MNRQWKRFVELSGKCYKELQGEKTDVQVWNQCYAELKEIIRRNREKNPDYALELYEIDDSSDYEYEVEGWLEDYRDTLEMMEEYEKLQTVCEELTGMFRWEEDSPTDLRFHIIIALQGRKKYVDAQTYGEKWYQEEADNPYAAAALIYARMGVENYDGAEQLVKHWIPEGTDCSDENDVLFIAAERLYKKTGNKEAQKRMKAAQEKYEKELEEYSDNLDEEEMLFF